MMRLSERTLPARQRVGGAWEHEQQLASSPTRKLGGSPATQKPPQKKLHESQSLPTLRGIMGDASPTTFHALPHSYSANTSPTQLLAKARRERTSSPSPSARAARAKRHTRGFAPTSPLGAALASSHAEGGKEEEEEGSSTAFEFDGKHKVTLSMSSSTGPVEIIDPFALASGATPAPKKKSLLAAAPAPDAEPKRSLFSMKASAVRKDVAAERIKVRLPFIVRRLPSSFPPLLLSSPL